MTPATPSQPIRRGRVAAADRHVQLLDAAADIVAAAGAGALTVDAVASKADVHRAVVYRHFDDAAALLDAVVERELGELRRLTTIAVEGVTGFEHRLRAATTAWMACFAARPRVMSVALLRRPVDHTERTRRQGQQRASMRFLVEEIRAAGVDDRDAEIAAAALLHGLVGVVELWAAKRIDRRVAIDRFVRFAVGAVGAFRNG